MRKEIKKKLLLKFMFFMHWLLITMFGLVRNSLSRFSTTIFDKILNKSIPSQAVYEDEHVKHYIWRFMLSKMCSHKHLFISLSFPKKRTVLSAFLM